MARVRVTDEIWAEFRAAVGWMPINLYLGELVSREVERERSRSLRAGKLADREVIDALERARELHEQLSAIVEWLEHRLDRTSSSGSDLDRSSQSWADEVD
jgi:DNA polymerase III epsilon subunit-like protein